MKQLALGVTLRADAVFGSFAAGDNRELLAALRGPDTAPLWLWGARSVGKTHLLQAVCSGAETAGPGIPRAGTADTAGPGIPRAGTADTAGPGTARADTADAAGPGTADAAAAYLPLARSQGLPPEALRGFEHARVLCLDDVDAVAGDAAWERSLFRLFNEAAELDTRLIFAARAAPRALDWSLEDWRSRAAACVVYQLRELDDAGRVEALQRRAAQRGLTLPQDAADYLLRRLPRDLPSLLEALDRLDDASMVAQRRLTVPFIRDALERTEGTEP